jgi:hypothetical protein
MPNAACDCDCYPMSVSSVCTNSTWNVSFAGGVTVTSERKQLTAEHSMPERESVNGMAALVTCVNRPTATLRGRGGTQPA